MGNKEDVKRSLDLDEPNEEPPPPYSEYTESTASNSLETSNGESSSSIAAHSDNIVDIPAHFSLYRSSHGLGHHFVIGGHRNKPVFAVTTHFGWMGMPDVVLHSGPTKDSPMLAGVNSDLFIRSTPVKLRLPGQPATDEHVQIAREGGAHRFIIDHGEPEGRTVYEWLPSLSPAVASVGGRTHWELVRYPEFHADQGKLVIAHWAFERGMSLSKELTFEFLDPSIQLTTGDAWAVMAMITALRIWDKTGKSVNNAGAQ
ncbi:hypothetical protein PFICI_06324 [Pestalotiopsis fici W106-1]|uniref:Phospholipid scramblase n=1 Tax=Pestalotiopsis fici (strain W106-1 / CGMCC3.15140) TaxID=1229662 RepID=W3X7G5_PESFW|nr:uncharacterized protein PFICI_06324 [Pestalotiopsis fici W106-1]ETS81322.1 hypothetical protein PFICI_06324 [Pestalotiopsis fici W106-1]